MAKFVEPDPYKQIDDRAQEFVDAGDLVAAETFQKEAHRLRSSAEREEVRRINPNAYDPYSSPLHLAPPPTASNHEVSVWKQRKAQEALENGTSREDSDDGQHHAIMD